MIDNYDDQMAARERFDAAYTQNAYMLFSMLRPSLAQDGNQWCVLYGDNLQVGIAGFGDTPHHAVLAWNAEWHKKTTIAAKKGEKE